MPVILILHLLAAVIWVGGMFFAYTALRPVASSLLEPPLRLALWSQVFARFFPWVWACMVVLLLTGFWMIFVTFGGMAQVGRYVHLMMTLGIIMMLLFLHLYFSPFRRLKQAVDNSDWPLAAGRLNQIRVLILINLILGLVVVAVAALGGYF